MIWMSRLIQRWANVRKFLQICGIALTVCQPKYDFLKLFKFTVKPVHNGHRRDRAMWPLWPGGRYGKN